MRSFEGSFAFVLTMTLVTLCGVHGLPTTNDRARPNKSHVYRTPREICNKVLNRNNTSRYECNCSGDYATNTKRIRKAWEKIFASFGNQDENQGLEVEMSTFIPTSKLYDCTVLSLRRLHKIAKPFGVTKFKRSLRDLCHGFMFNDCCYRQVERPRSVRGYLKEPTCTKILEILASGCRGNKNKNNSNNSDGSDSATGKGRTTEDILSSLRFWKGSRLDDNSGYSRSVKFIIYDELRRSEKFLRTYLQRTFI